MFCSSRRARKALFFVLHCQQKRFPSPFAQVKKQSNKAGDKAIYSVAVKAPTENMVKAHISRMSPNAQRYVLQKPLSQQFPACLSRSSGLLGATTNNWAEQEMKALNDSLVRSAPNMFEALIKTVEYSTRIYNENYKLAHAQKEKDRATPKFLESFNEAKNRAYEQDKPTLGHDVKVCQVKSATDETTVYESRLREGASHCSCGTFKTTGKFCWHFAQHCRVASLDPWICKIMFTQNIFIIRILFQP